MKQPKIEILFIILSLIISISSIFILFFMSFLVIPANGWNVLTTIGIICGIILLFFIPVSIFFIKKYRCNKMKQYIYGFTCTNNIEKKDVQYKKYHEHYLYNISTIIFLVSLSLIFIYTLLFVLGDNNDDGRIFGVISGFIMLLLSYPIYYFFHKKQVCNTENKGIFGYTCKDIKSL